MATQSSIVISAQAHLVISDAFDRFKATVTPDDQKLLDSTTVEDVVNAMMVIQQDLRNRRDNRNLRKLHPFLQGLRTYGQAVDVLSNGLSPFLPWAWAPVKLMLQITLDYLVAFDKLVEAYARIADTLPRIETIGDAFKDNPSMLTKLALYYADILEFHRRAYKFVRRKSWIFFFKTTWAQFDVRFESILASMAHHSDMIAQEAATINIIEARQWREKLMAEAAQKERDRSDQQRLSVISWLGVGSDDSGMPALFYFCGYHSVDKSSEILKALILQMIEKNTDLIAIAYTDFVLRHPMPSLKVLRAMLIGSTDKPGILHGMSSCRIVIDGIDECDDKEQRFIIEDLVQFVSANKSSYNCKLLLCSRSVPTISRTLQKKSKALLEISLSTEHTCVNASIQAFIKKRLQDIDEEHPAFQLDSNAMEELSEMILDKADVMESLSDIDSIEELHTAITQMPKELPKLYAAIIDRLSRQTEVQSMEKVYRILAWLIFSKRPLKRHELLHGAALTYENPFLDRWNMLYETAIDKCKPLVEDLPDGTIALVHSTVQEYLATDCAIQSFQPSKREDLIAFACLSVLKNGLSLLDPDMSAHQQLSQVMNGFHALLPYSIDFWVQHLLGSATRHRLEPDSHTALALASFDSLHKHCCQKLNRATDRLPLDQSNDTRLETISHLPSMSICACFLSFQQNRKSQSAATGEELDKVALENDPTLLSALSATFNKLVNQLISGVDIPEGLNAARGVGLDSEDSKT
ncbi:hypothetical protein DL770_007179 [Monosporascus sp. CRB-9-2]|nr:hypothetical protein DL770_007179 [Monosporascus sp. CRB-9-2]